MLGTFILMGIESHKKRLDRVSQFLPSDLALLEDSSRFSIVKPSKEVPGTMDYIAPSQQYVRSRRFHPPDAKVTRIERWGHVYVFTVKLRRTSETIEIVVYDPKSGKPESFHERGNADSALRQQGLYMNDYIDTPHL
jgi:hypothetical protein